jgi:hypothetical protein
VVAGVAGEMVPAVGRVEHRRGVDQEAESSVGGSNAAMMPAATKRP